MGIVHPKSEIMSFELLIGIVRLSANKTTRTIRPLRPSLLSPSVHNTIDAITTVGNITAPAAKNNCNEKITPNMRTKVVVILLRTRRRNTVTID